MVKICKNNYRDYGSQRYRKTTDCYRGQFIDDIKKLLEAARNNVVKQVNTTMLTLTSRSAVGLSSRSRMGKVKQIMGNICSCVYLSLFLGVSGKDSQKETLN